MKKYQKDFIAKYPNFTGAKVVKGSIDPEIPDFKGADEKEIQRKDKALAEAAALLVLQKKFQALWEDAES